MTEMVTSGSMSGEGKRSDGLLGERGPERTPLDSGAAGPVRHRASPRLYTAAARLPHFGSSRPGSRRLRGLALASNLFVNAPWERHAFQSIRSMRCSAANRDVGFVAKAFDDALDLDISKAED